jgi:hypothetical protein
MPASPFKFAYQDRILLVGSCFAENMGDKMLEYKFNVEVNPFGILYNPLSIAAACRRMLHPEAYTEEDLFFHDGRYHSFAHHGRFSDASPGKCLSGINASLERAAALLRRSACLIVTFGTAFVYRQKDSAVVAANCHKLPESAFTRERLSVGEITAEWSALTEALRQANPSLKIILTVSPVRHRKDGAHLNQVSKSILLLAEQTLAEEYPGQIMYFPAYELMMDELRDYRFYAEDMIHPSPAAIRHIWERFCDVFIDRDTQSYMKEVEAVNRNLNHQPATGNRDAYRSFLVQTLLKIRSLQSRNPAVCLSKEAAEIEEKLKHY